MSQKIAKACLPFDARDLYSERSGADEKGYRLMKGHTLTKTGIAQEAVGAVNRRYQKVIFPGNHLLRNSRAFLSDSLFEILGCRAVYINAPYSVSISQETFGQQLSSVDQIQD